MGNARMRCVIHKVFKLWCVRSQLTQEFNESVGQPVPALAGRVNTRGPPNSFFPVEKTQFGHTLCPTMKTLHLLLTVLLFTFSVFAFCAEEPATSAEPSFLVCSGAAAGGYAAFPDVCRLQNGELLSVFYSGYGHVSLPNTDWPKGGRIMAARSTDEGQTWSAPTVIIDTTRDDRDPSVVQLKDGTLLMDWFSYEDQKSKDKDRLRVLFARSADGGATWSEPYPLNLDIPFLVACSTPARLLPDGSLILGLYHESADGSTAYGATAKSFDGGKTWKDFTTIDENSKVRLDAETDVILLKDGTLYAALRGSACNMHYSLSTDLGKTWGPVKDIGFLGHCPYLLRHSSGVILLGLRIPRENPDVSGNGVYWSNDDTKTWQGPLLIDKRIGAYPSLVETKDGKVLCVYYEEGTGSGIRCAPLIVNEGQVRLATQ